MEWAIYLFIEIVTYMLIINGVDDLLCWCWWSMVL